MLSEVIVGNVCSLCAMVTDSISGTRKKRSQILGVQMISQVFYGAGSIILKGYSSTAQNLVAILRNYAAMKNVKSRVVEWILISLGVVLGVIFNNRELLDLLPVAANLEYSVAMFRFKNNDRGLKISFIVNMLMYSVFSFAIMNYVGFAANIVVAVTTLVSLIRGGAKEKTAAEPEEQPADADRED
ncbi:MAG: YgjV family protein [Oscillospiraceae bacterium]|nr:YgjV family protein [Oscillospiraceae bacterium]